MAKAIEKRCERCNETVRMLPSSRYCPECRPIVLKELKKKGYFTSVSGVRKYPSKMQKEYEEDIHAGGRFTEYEEKQFKGDWDWNAPQS